METWGDLTWGECFPVDWTSRRPSLRPSSGCPCPSPCPGRPPQTDGSRKGALSKTPQDDGEQDGSSTGVSVETGQAEASDLAVSSAGRVHVEDDLSLVLGRVGPRRAAP